MQIKLICILCDTGGKVSYTFPSCVPVDFPASDANSAHSPLAEFCVPCVPSGTGGTLLSQPSHKTTQAPCSPPGGPFWPSFTPGGETPAPARSGAGLGHTGANLAEVTGEAGKPFFVFCFSLAGNKTHRSLNPTHSSLLGRASRAPARRCRSAQKAGRSRLPARSARGGPHRGPSPPHPLCRKERSL